jgi:hypothetical protein
MIHNVECLRADFNRLSFMHPHPSNHRRVDVPAINTVISPGRIWNSDPGEHTAATVSMAAARKRGARLDPDDGAYARILTPRFGKSSV